MDIFQILLAISGLLAILLIHKQGKTRNWPRANTGRKSPPEPAGAWPVIGHLHKLGGPNPMQRTLPEFADKYGPIFILKLGVQKALMVSNWEAVKESFTTNDKAFANRPPLISGTYLGYNYAAFGFSPYGPYWRRDAKVGFVRSTFKSEA